MHLDTAVTDAWLRTGRLPDPDAAGAWPLRVAAGDDEPPVPAEEPDPGLAPQVRAALAAVRSALHPFRPARPALWDVALLGWPEAVGAARVALVVGWPAPYDAGVRRNPRGRPVIVLDLVRLLAASGAPGAVPDAAQGLLDHELAHVVLDARDPLPAGAAYADRLDRIVWDEGLAHHLGMGTHPLVVPGAERRLERQWRALAELAEARAATGEDARAAWLRRADAADGFWEKYACVAGMLAFGDAEHAGGPQAVRDLVDAGWRGFADRVLAGLSPA